jgi:hypothetical protein
MGSARIGLPRRHGGNLWGGIYFLPTKKREELFRADSIALVFDSPPGIVK